MSLKEMIYPGLKNDINKPKYLEIWSRELAAQEAAK